MNKDEIDHFLFFGWWRRPKKTFKTEEPPIKNLCDVLQAVVWEMSKEGDGVFLSSGVDSSIVASLMSSPIAFTVKWNKDDESKKAIRIAKHLGIEQHHIVDFEEEDFWSVDKKIFEALERPLADPSIYAQWKVTKEASKFCKRILTGDCGDEMFLGYIDYKQYYRLQQLQSIPRFMRKFASIFLKGTLKKGVEWSLMDENSIPVHFFKRMRYQNPFSCPSAENIVREHFALYKNYVEAQNDFYKRYLVSGCWEPKIMTPAKKFKVEIKMPFSHPHIAWLSENMSVKQKLGKKPLVKAFRSKLPKIVFKYTLSKKQGFEPPWMDWINNNRDYFEEELRKLDSRNIVSQAGIKECINQLNKGNKLAYEIIFRVYCLERWIDCHKGKW